MPKGKPNNKENQLSKPKRGKGMPSTKVDNIKKRAQRNSAFKPKEENEPLQAAGPTSNIMPYLHDEDVKHTISRGLYSDELLPVVSKYCEQGLTNNQIAKSLCIGEKTFYEWRHRYPQFAQCLMKYRGVTNEIIENAFIANCTGYGYTEQMATAVGKVVSVQKWKAADTRAQIHYLQNRMPERYKRDNEKIQTQITNIENITFSLKKRED